MRRIPSLVMLLALTLLGSTTATAQGPQLPGGRFFDDNETIHEPNIEAIAALSITLGCVVEGTAYCPEREVTRAQMATFITRALGLERLPNSFDDVDPASSHAGNIAAIREAGITLGCDASGANYCPNDSVTREQMASFLARAFDITPRSSGPFSDVSGTHLSNINAIAYAGITLGCNSDGTLFCPDRDVTRGEMASFLARGLGLEPVILLPRVQLTDVQAVCTGSTPVCSGTSGGSNSGAFYIQEGWFYNLPYSAGDQNRDSSPLTSACSSTMMRSSTSSGCRRRTSTEPWWRSMDTWSPISHQAYTRSSASGGGTATPPSRRWWCSRSPDDHRKATVGETLGGYRRYDSRKRTRENYVHMIRI